MTANLNSLLPQEDKPHIQQMTEFLREKYRNPEFLKEITKDAFIPVGKTDAELMEALLDFEEDEFLPFEET